MSVCLSVILSVYYLFIACCSFVFCRFWNLGLEKMFTQANLKKESEYFSTRHDIAKALLPPDELPSAPTIICNRKSSVTLDLLGSDTDSFVYSLRLSVDEFHSLKKKFN